MSNNAPTIILSHPQMGENIGASARAMQNFGLSDLRLVAPRDGWPNERADANAAGALEIMPSVQVFDSLRDAVSDLHYVFATTSRRRDMVKPTFNPESAITETNKRIDENQRIGFVFGAERSGLTNDEVSLCQAIITFPVNPEFASLNLAQSVLLLAYQWGSMTSRKPRMVLNTGDSAPALQKDIQTFIERLEHDLEDRNFFRADDLKPTMLRNIQNIFTRSDITDQELRTLHGILSALRGNKEPK